MNTNIDIKIYLKHILTHFKLSVNAFLGYLMPYTCLCCGKKVEHKHNLCFECFNKLNFITEPLCECCGVPFKSEEASKICALCLSNPPIYLKSRSVFLYDDASRKLITSFKYSDKTELSILLGKYLYKFGSDIIAPEKIIIPVPIHSLKLISRKYNQSALLAKELSKLCSLKVLYNVLIKNKMSKPQAGLNFSKRQENLKNSFIIKNKKLIKGKEIILIDDVITTGATIEKCCRKLLQAGVKSVEVLSVAKRCKTN